MDNIAAILRHLGIDAREPIRYTPAEPQDEREPTYEQRAAIDAMADKYGVAAVSRPSGPTQSVTITGLSDDIERERWVVDADGTHYTIY